MTRPTRAKSSKLGQLELEFATFHEGYVSRYIQLADAKAGTALIIIATTLGYLLSIDRFVSALLLHSNCRNSALAIATTLMLTGSGCWSFFVIAPRGGSRGNSLIYWSDVARRQTRDFVDAVQAAGLEGIAREHLEHAHAIAKICDRKYRSLREIGRAHV